MRRFFSVLVGVLLAAAALAGIARALDFDDEDPNPPHAEVGMVYSYEIGTHAGCLPHRLEILSGQLPPGLSIRRIDYDTHVVEGIATEAGTFNVWLAVRDCDNRSAETLFPFEVWARRWAISTNSLQRAGLGAPYSANLQGAGPDSVVTWKVTAGSLPSGLTLSPEGAISGTPTAAGSFTFTVEATAKEKNFGPTRVDTKQFTLQVTSLAASLSRRVAEAGVPFRSSLAASGGNAPYSWTAVGLPAGLALGADGVLSGKPKRAGSFVVRARLVDADGVAANVEVRLAVRAHVVIATKALPAGRAGGSYNARLEVRGGLGGFRWSAAGLPAGLRLAAGSGRITGAPGRAGAFRVTVRVRDALGGLARKTLTLRVR